MYDRNEQMHLTPCLDPARLTLHGERSSLCSFWLVASHYVVLQWLMPKSGAKKQDIVKKARDKRCTHCHRSVAGAIQKHTGSGDGRGQTYLWALCYGTCCLGRARYFFFFFRAPVLSSFLRFAPLLAQTTYNRRPWQRSKCCRTSRCAE